MNEECYEPAVAAVYSEGVCIGCGLAPWVNEEGYVYSQQLLQCIVKVFV